MEMTSFSEFKGNSIKLSSRFDHIISNNVLIINDSLYQNKPT